MLIQKNKSNSDEVAASFLKRGEVIVLPTDTIYGFSGIIPYTKEKIFHIKKRSVFKELIALIAEPKDIFKYTCTLIPKVLFDLWPGPLTLIVKDKQGGGSSAFRCPKDEWLHSVINKTGNAVYSTSVNYSGNPSLTKIEDIKKEFEDKISLIVDGGEAYNNSLRQASTIISLLEKRPIVVREGAVTVPHLF